jgi:hypothetical protein
MSKGKVVLGSKMLELVAIEDEVLGADAGAW